MPQAIAQIKQTAPIVQFEDIALLIHVGNIHKLRRHAPLDVRLQDAVNGVQRSEVLCKGYLVVLAHGDASDYCHREVIHSVDDKVAGACVQRQGQIDPGDLGPKGRSKGSDGSAHLRHLAASSPAM